MRPNPCRVVLLCVSLGLPVATPAAESAAAPVLDCPLARSLPANVDDESRRIACAFKQEFQEDVFMAQLMGRQLWVADQAAWVSTDALRDAGALKRMEGRIGAGWLTARTSDVENRWRVAYLVRDGDVVTAWAEVDVWFKGGPPEMKVQLHDTPRALTMEEQAQLRAKSLVLEQDMLACSQRHNVAIVPFGEVDADVLHVYVMPVQARQNAYPMGGFHDFRVTADGSRVLSHFAQTRSCLEQEQPPGTSAFVVSHLNSPTPTAFHVFFSLTYGKPVYVSTSDGLLWRVEKGRIHPVVDPVPGSAEAAAAEGMKADAGAPDARQ